MGGQTNEADLAAVMDVVRAYCDGMVAGDEKLLERAFHPRASIVGNEHGVLEWETLEEFIDECREAADDAGPGTWRLEGLSLVGDMAAIRLGTQFAGEWYTDDLSLLCIDGTWCIVHKTWYVHPSSAQPH